MKKLIGLCLILSACGGDRGANDSQTTPTSAVVSNLTVDEAYNMLKTVKLVCPIAEDCPDSVAILGAVERKNIDHTNGYESYICTSFLVAPNVMATAAHCIPEKIRKNGADCSRDIKVSFSDGLVHDCAKILLTSNAGLDALGIHPDYAFFSLKDEPQRSPLKVQRSGFGDKESVDVFAVNPAISDTALKGKLTIKKCEVNFKASYGFENPFYAHVVLNPCHIIPGNSGAPVIDALGEVGAIISLYDKTHPLTDSTNVSYSAVATNFACIDETNLNMPWKKSDLCPLTIPLPGSKK